MLTQKCQRRYFGPRRAGGARSLYAAKSCAHCYAIDPNPVTYEYLVENIDLNPDIRPKITPFQAAISDRNGLVTLGGPVKPYGSASSILFPAAATTWTVKTVTFDRFREIHAIDEVGFIKMDIEGAEYPSYARAFFDPKAIRFDQSVCGLK